ncbi:sodium-independent sulfate anion transporter [Anabrus simplex]|uniref:sodium-independent sulfate anion transporter n=1 Tax=Anabrus simplex TaxID=316456 RepID=UPI0035A2C087
MAVKEKTQVHVRLARKGKQLLIQHVPILSWLPHYTKLDGVADVIAGLTIGLTMMPQSIAYASLAGLSAEYGLYSAFMGSLVYMVFGTIKEVSIGPTSLMALLTFEYTQDLPIEFVVLLAFLAGCVELLMGILKLGFLVDFISAPVTSGFTSATSVIIIVSQMKGLLGIKFKSQNFIDNLRQLVIHAPGTRLWDAILGFSCIIFLLALRQLNSIPVGPKDPSMRTPRHKMIKKGLWFISICRNALIVLISSVIAFKLDASGQPFILSGKVAPGLPPAGLPPFSAQVGNHTYTFPEMCQELGMAILLVPIVAVLANVAIAKAFTTGASLNATQEMLTLGLCNIFGSFFQAMPTCGAFTRSAVSNSSGVRTPMSGLYSGTLILLALSFLTPCFYFIPRATLSAVLISAVIFMIEWQVALTLWYTSKREFALLVLTFLACLCQGVEVGLLVGTGVNILFLLYLWARPTIAIEKQKNCVGGEYLIVTPDIGLFYPSVDFLRIEVCKAAVSQGEGVLPVVINCSNFKGVDYTTAKAVQMLLNDFEKRRQVLVFYNLKPNDVAIFHGAKVENLQYCNSEEELIDLLFGEKLDLARSETLPLLGRALQSQKPVLDTSEKKTPAAVEEHSVISIEKTET